MGKIEALRRVVSDAIGPQGLELVDVETGPGLVRVLLDRPGGIDMDALTEANKLISKALDSHDEVAPKGNYGLEVSSPGVERPLVEAKHFEAFIGSQVSIRTKAGVEGERRIQGRIASVESDTVLVDLSSGQRRIALGDIERARTVFDWGSREGNTGRKKPKQNKAEGASRA